MVMNAGLTARWDSSLIFHWNW